MVASSLADTEGIERELYCAVLRTMSEGACAVRASDELIVFASPQFAKMMGYEPGELEGKHARLLLLPGDEAASAAVFAQVRERGCGTYDLRPVRKDGASLVCRAALSTVHLPGHGEVWVAVVEDVTERRSQELDRERLFELTVDMLFVASMDGYLIRVNPAWVNVLGYSEAELCAQPFLDFVHPDDRERTRQEAARLRAGGDTMSFRNRYRCKDGTYRMLEWRSRVAFAERRIYGVARDVTEQEKAQRARARLASIVESSHDAIIGKSTDGVIEFWNAAAEQLLGYKAEEIVGQSVALIVPLEKRAEEQWILENMRRGDHIQLVETVRRRKDGTVVEVSLAASPLRAENGEVIGISSVLHDITTRKATLRQVERSLSEKEVLLREIHHRVKNNLQVIASLVGLQAFHTNEAAAKELLQEVRGRVRAIALLHDKLYRSPDLASIPAADYLHELCLAVQGAQSLRKPVEIVVQAPEVFLHIDEAVPCGLIVNEAVTNAFKHAFRDDRPDCRVEVRMARTDGQTELRISDTGPGIGASTDAKNPQTLGLTLIHTLARQLRGTASFHNQGGLVCTVTYNR